MVERERVKSVNTVKDKRVQIIEALEGDKNIEDLKKYCSRMSAVNNEFFYIDFVPYSVAENLTEGITKLDPSKRHNGSPTMKELLELAKKYNGLLEGYVIPKASKREDYRITFDGIVLPITKEMALMLRSKFKPDEFDQTPQGWRFWWD